MGRRRRRQRLPAEPVDIEIHGLDHECRGVGQIDGKTVFVGGALAGEKVSFKYTKQRKTWDEGYAVSVLDASNERVEPGCPHFGVCGGCSLQHMRPSAQIHAKQQVLLDNLQQIGRVEAGEILPPLTSEDVFGYRNKARLGVRFVRKKDRVLVGFRERGNSFITDLQQCPVLNPVAGDRIEQVAEMIGRLSIREQVAQIEFAAGDDSAVFVFRNLAEPSAEDLSLLREFQHDSGIHVYLQPGNESTIAPLGDGTTLSYRLPAHDIEIRFLPTDFTQVNAQLNQRMLDCALALLQPEKTDRVLDLFCGLGNFTLPIARQVAQVTGVEGDAGLVERARANAQHNGIDNVDYYTANLYEDLEHEPWISQSYDKALIDPPRSGAREVLPLIDSMGIRRLVYVSCYPGTLARDAGILVNEYGFRLQKAGVMDMFPHTAHVESIALFEKTG